MKKKKKKKKRFENGNKSSYKCILILVLNSWQPVLFLKAAKQQESKHSRSQRATTAAIQNAELGVSIHLEFTELVKVAQI